jgi:hypothetical protein
MPNLIKSHNLATAKAAGRAPKQQPYTGPRPTVLIGVDPAFRPGGFWICIIDKSDMTANFRNFETVLHFDRWLRSDEAPETAIVSIENSNLQKVTFGKMRNGEYEKGGNESKQLLASRSRNVGTNQAVSQLAVKAAVDRYGKSCVIEISPRQKGGKIWDEKQFGWIVQADRVRLMCQVGKAKQDMRDAYMLAQMGGQQWGLMNRQTKTV